MYERFTEQARQVMKIAEDISEQLGHNYMGTEHILIGLLDAEGVASKILVTNGLDKDKLMDSAKAYGKSPYGEHLKKVAEGKVRY